MKRAIRLSMEKASKCCKKSQTTKRFVAKNTKKIFPFKFQYGNYNLQEELKGFNDKIICNKCLCQVRGEYDGYTERTYVIYI